MESEPSLIFAALLLLPGVLLLVWGAGEGDDPIIVHLCALLLLGAGVGFVSGKLSVLQHTPPPFEATVGPSIVEGWITKIEPARRGVRLRLAVHSVDGATLKQRELHIRLTHLRDLEVEVGRFVRCWSVVRPPPAPILPQDYAFDRHAYFSDLDAVGFVQGRCRAGSAGPQTGFWHTTSYRLATSRRSLAHYVADRAGRRAGGFAAALISGDRSLMSERDREALRQSGLAHLMAISGLHMGLACGLVFLFAQRFLALIEPLALRFSVKKFAAALALLAGMAYLFVSGGSVSTQRAYVMALVFFTAILVDRRAVSLQSLALAMCLIVLWQPWTVLTPGFQMSFGATGALITAYDVWRSRRSDESLPLRGAAFWFKSLVVTAIVSTVATAPFAFYHFDRVATMSMFANLFAMPVISLVSAPTALLAALLSPFGLADGALAMFGLSLEWVLRIAHVFADTDMKMVAGSKPMPAFTLASFAIALSLQCLAFNRFWYATLSFFLLGAIIWSMSSPFILHWSPKGDVFYQSEAGTMKRVRLAKGDGMVPIGWRDAPMEKDCAENGCVLQTKAGQILILGRRAPHRCQQIKPMLLILVVEELGLPSGCDAKLVRWADIDRRRGATWRHSLGKSVRARSLQCGRRPWQTCYNSRAVTRSDE